MRSTDCLTGDGCRRSIMAGCDFGRALASFLAGLPLFPLLFIVLVVETCATGVDGIVHCHEGECARDIRTCGTCSGSACVRHTRQTHHFPEQNAAHSGTSSSSAVTVLTCLPTGVHLPEGCRSQEVYDGRVCVCYKNYCNGATDLRPMNFVCIVVLSALVTIFTVDIAMFRRRLNLS